MSRYVAALETPTSAETHARLCRFGDWLMCQWGQPYREVTPEERAWIDEGIGEPPACVQRLQDARAKGDLKL